MAGYRERCWLVLEVMDWFCGAGGSSQGIAAVPHVRVARAANHWGKDRVAFGELPGGRSLSGGYP